MTSSLKVGDVANKLRAAMGPSWKEESWDGLQAGCLDSKVNGIAVVWTPSMEALTEAANLGCNLILCKEPLYWWENEGPAKGDIITSRMGNATPVPAEFGAVDKPSVYRAKKQYIAANKLNIYRMAMNWDGTQQLSTQGFLRALDWKATDSFVADNRNPNVRTAIVQIPSQTLLAVAEFAKNSIGGWSTRVVGEPTAKISKVALHPGYLTVAAASRIAQSPGLDAILTGESCEWEAFVYAEDWITAGHGKGLIMTGLAATSSLGAPDVASWVQQLLPSARIEALAVRDPFTPIYAGGLRA